MLLIDKSLGPSRNRIILTQGDSASLLLALTDKDENEVTLSNDDTAVFTVKKSISDTAHVLQLAISSAGQFSFRPADTSGLECGEYWYDVEVRLADGEVYTVVPPSKFILAKGVS